ncbi:hypothetical protein PE36_07342 [Moritella sp. PE36]|uniref:hypothetical protein n=1 Tax=Moritella sp. PE36 TaxID=58051 RepID=UPI00015689C4|nr:hypothetical protein [Moritella sp. PE36]EDM69283.1 hypothetical protein PE36_07342 [Moritella sp. PE36]
MAKKPKYNFYAAINDKEARIVTTWAECAAIAIGKPGGDNKGAFTLEEAEKYLKQITKERTARQKRNKPKRGRNTNLPPKPKEDLSYLAKVSAPKQPKVVTLTCKLGTGGLGSTIKSLDCDTHIIETSTGAKTAQMYLEFGYAALKLADYHIKQGADTVEIIGLNASVGNTLNNFAPNWKANNWLNSAGKSPANLELVQSVFTLYGRIKAKVTLGVKQPKAAHTDDLPF